jgi:hypothetical protein
MGWEISFPHRNWTITIVDLTNLLFYSCSMSDHASDAEEDPPAGDGGAQQDAEDGAGDGAGDGEDDGEGGGEERSEGGSDNDGEGGAEDAGQAQTQVLPPTQLLTQASAEYQTQAYSQTNDVPSQNNGPPATVDLSLESSSDEDERQAKRLRMEPEVIWVLTKGDFPSDAGGKIVRVEVLGTYSSEEGADDAKEDFLADGGWEEGVAGFHQGDSAVESAIEVHAAEMDAPTCAQ